MLTNLSGDLVSNLKMKHINFANNILSDIPRDYLKGQHDLEYFDVSLNLLTNVPEGLFQDTSVLKYLDMSQNRIPFFSDDIFTNLTHLKELALCGNSLQNLKFLSPLRALSSLKLSDNQILNIKERDFEKSANLSHLDLSKNKI